MVRGRVPRHAGRNSGGYRNRPAPVQRNGNRVKLCSILDLCVKIHVAGSVMFDQSVICFMSIHLMGGAGRDFKYKRLLWPSVDYFLSEDRDTRDSSIDGSCLEVCKCCWGARGWACYSFLAEFDSRPHWDVTWPEMKNEVGLFQTKSFNQKNRNWDFGFVKFNGSSDSLSHLVSQRQFHSLVIIIVGIVSVHSIPGFWTWLCGVPRQSRQWWRSQSRSKLSQSWQLL